MAKNINLLTILLFLVITPAAAQHFLSNQPVLAKAITFLYVDLDNDKIMDSNEFLVVMAADDYRRIFNRTPPLERMLRSQINNNEFIVLNHADFTNMDINKDKVITAADRVTLKKYAVDMRKTAPIAAKLKQTKKPTIFLYRKAKLWHYIVVFPGEPAVYGYISKQNLKQILGIKEFKELTYKNNSYQLSSQQKMKILSNIMKPMYKIYFAQASGTIKGALIATKAEIVDIGKLKN